MTTFGKIFDQIFESSIAEHYQTRHIFMDLIVLGWPDGLIDKTYEAISRRINVPIAIVITAIGELEQPDVQSRTKKFEGARLLRLTDSDGKPRPWGWKIVNYEAYLKLRSKEKEAKSSAERVRNHRERKKREKQDCNGCNGTAPPVTPVTVCNTCGGPVAGENVTICNKCNTLGNANQSKSKNKSSCCTHRGPELNLQSAREFLNAFAKRHFIRTPTPTQWQNLFDSHLAEAMPIFQGDLETLDWFYGLENDQMQELRTGRRKEFANVMTYLSGEIEKAYAAKKQLQTESHSRKKNDPAKWREFLRWKYDEKVRLPAEFEDLDPDLQAEYRAGIAKFNEVAK